MGFDHLADTSYIRLHNFVLRQVCFMKQEAVAVELGKINTSMTHLTNYVKSIDENGKITNGHVTTCIQNIALNKRETELAKEKAEEAKADAGDAKKTAGGYLKWIITIVLGNLLCFATILTFIAYFD